MGGGGGGGRPPLAGKRCGRPCRVCTWSARRPRQRARRHTGLGEQRSRRAQTKRSAFVLPSTHHTHTHPADPTPHPTFFIPTHTDTPHRSAHTHGHTESTHPHCRHASGCRMRARQARKTPRTDFFPAAALPAPGPPTACGRGATPLRRGCAVPAAAAPTQGRAHTTAAHASSRSHARSIHALLATERAPRRPSLPKLFARQPNKDRKHGLAPQASGPPIVVAPTQHSASANHGPSVTDPLPNPTRMVFRASARSWRSSCKSRLGWEECAC